LRLLFDQNVPAPLAKLLFAHEVRTAEQMGWQAVSNGDLLAVADRQGFDVLITADQNLRYQQNLTTRRIGLIVLSTNNWNVLRENSLAVLDAVAAAGQGSYLELGLPRPALVRRSPTEQGR